MLAIEKARKRFASGDDAVVTALDDVSLELEPGAFVTVIGSNGAGKSTLLKSVAGLLMLDSGRIALDGQDITRAPAHARARLIGRIAQDPHESTCSVMTIEENLAIAAKRGQHRGLSLAVTAAARDRFRAALADVGLGLEARLAARVGTLSGGQRQALALLMATLARPRLLLLDEHLASLDPKTAEAVMGLTGRLVAAGRLTTLMVTHNMQDAIRWGDRLIMMHEGRIVLDLRGAEKGALTVPGLIERFHGVSRGGFATDRALLS
ncbi:MAG: ATP-binding cassette domain-containing protein [Alphaproteobacteria bacterium]|nr:ATP-binding cassette domain-containing protein [Alphaproteobacteria bacterium]